MSVERFQKLILPQNASIKQALETLSKADPYQIIFVCDQKQAIIGTVTDGDIRRALLQGEGLNSPLTKVMHQSFVWSVPSSDRHETIRLMRQHGVRQIPVLDEQKKLLDVKLLDHFIEKPLTSEFAVVIMAGGKGSRLHPYTENTPKCLLKIGNRTIIERIISNFQSKGVSDFIITVHHLAEQIMDYLGDGKRFQCKIQYLKEPRPLGTAGGLSLLREKIPYHFLVINGDVLSSVDIELLAYFHEENGVDATICTKAYPLNIPYGLVHMKDNSFISIEEKPVFYFKINAGIYFFSRSVLSFIHDDEYLDMPTFLDRLVAKGKKVKCFQSMEPWVDIGSHVEFERAQKFEEYLI